MKQFKKLNTKGFAHWIMPLIAVIAIGAIGSYVYLRSSHAATITKTACVKSGGVWLDLQSQGVSHGPCWSTKGAYLVNYGAGKVGDGVDQLSSGQSEKMNYPNYIIVVSGNWQVCGKTSCSNRSDPFTHTQSAPYVISGGREGHLKGSAYNLCANDYYWYSASGARSYSKLCTDTGIYIKRV